MDAKELTGGVVVIGLGSGLGSGGEGFLNRVGRRVCCGAAVIGMRLRSIHNTGMRLAHLMM